MLVIDSFKLFVLVLKACKLDFRPAPKHVDDFLTRLHFVSSSSAENLNDGFVRDSGVTFHKIGIGVVDTNYGFNGWKIRTLSRLQQMIFLLL